MENRARLAHLVVVGGGVVEGGARPTAKASVARYLAELADLCDRVEWIASASSERRYVTSIDPRVRITLLPSRTFGVLTGWRALDPVLERTGPETVVIQFLPMPTLLPLTLRLARRAGALVAYVGGNADRIADDYRVRGDALRSAAFRHATRAVLRRSALALVRGAELRDAVRPFVTTVHETPPISLAPDAVEEARATTWLQLLYVGKLVQGKGVGVAIRACAELRRRGGPDVRLAIVGSGPAEQPLRSLAASEGVDDAVEFAGYVDDADELAQRFADADVVVIPSVAPEGLPRVLDEACLSGRAIVASAVGGVPGAVLDGVEALLHKPGDVSGLADAIAALAVPERRAMLAAGAAARGERLRAGPSAATVHVAVAASALDRSRPHVDVAVVTNMLAPYRVPLFNVLATRVGRLLVLPAELRSADREWDVPVDEVRFELDVVDGGGHSALRRTVGTVRRLRRARPRAIVVGGVARPELLVAAIYGMVTRRPTIGWGGPVVGASGWRPRLLRAIERRVFDAYVAYGSGALDALTSGGYPRERVVVGVNVGDVGFYGGGDVGAANEVARLLFVGQLTERKGIRELLDALGDVRAAPWHLTIVGSGPLRDEVQAHVDTHLAGRCNLTGFVQREDLCHLLSSSDVFVLPALLDAAAIALSEALAAGAYVIASVHDGVAADLLTDRSLGVVIDPADRTSLAGAIGRAVADPALRAGRAERRERFLAADPLGRYAAAFERALEIAVTRRRGRRVRSRR